MASSSQRQQQQHLNNFSKHRVSSNSGSRQISSSDYASLQQPQPLVKEAASSNRRSSNQHSGSIHSQQYQVHSQHQKQQMALRKSGSSSGGGGGINPENQVFNPMALLQNANLQDSVSTNQSSRGGGGDRYTASGGHHASNSASLKLTSQTNSNCSHRRHQAAKSSVGATTTLKQSSKEHQLKQKHQMNSQNANTLLQLSGNGNHQQLNFTASGHQNNGRNPIDGSNIAIQSQKAHHQRGKFQGSFLASHNSKAKVSGVQKIITDGHKTRVKGNFSASPTHHPNHPSAVGQQPMLLKQNPGQHQQVKIQNKSPVAISNPSTFTISTTQNNMMLNSQSPNNANSNGSNGSQRGGATVHKFNHNNGAAGSNPTSTKHNSTKQTVTSDILMATDQSSVKQRENIKVFSFKPGNLKVQPKQLNVASIKTSQISIGSKELAAQMMSNKAKTRVPTNAQPSPQGLSKEGNIFTKVRNRSSGSGGSGTEIGVGHGGQKAFVSQRASLNTSNNNKSSAKNQYYSPDGTVSSESKQPVNVMQPNIVKKPLMTTNYSHREEHSAESSAMPTDYHTPDQVQQSQQPLTLRGKKSSKGATQLMMSSVPQQTQLRPESSGKRIKSATRQTTQNQQQSIQTSKGGTNGGTNQTHASNVSSQHGLNMQKIKIKKRGHSENIQTETSNNLRVGKGFFVMSSSTNHNTNPSGTTAAAAASMTPAPATSSKASSSQPQHSKGAKSNHFTQRGSSLMQPKTTQISEVSKKLLVINKQQYQHEDGRSLANQPGNAADHKEIIVNHIRKYIKVGSGDTPGQPASAHDKGEKTETIIQNLRDFLTYLENKNIINPQKLQDQNEMKSLIKDIMKLDLSKFSKPRNSSQPRQPQHQQHQTTAAMKVDQDEQQTTSRQLDKKRKVMPSPATHSLQPDSRSVPTQFSAATNSSQQSIANFAKMKQQMNQLIDQKSGGSGASGLQGKLHARTKNTSMETSPQQIVKPGPINSSGYTKYEYASQPKYLNYGLIAQQQQRGGIKTTGHRSRENSGSTRSPARQQSTTADQKLNMSQVNFVLPSNRTTNRNHHQKDGILSSTAAQQDIYGVNSIQSSHLQSSQNSPSGQSQNKNHYKLYQREKYQVKAAQHDSLLHSRTNESQASNRELIQSQEMSIRVDKKQKKSLTNKHHVRNNQSNSDSIAVEEQLKQLKPTAKPRLNVAPRRNSKTCVPSTQCSPKSGQPLNIVGTAHSKVCSQPNLTSQQQQQQQQNQQAPATYQLINDATGALSQQQQQQQQVPTIQLMINTNGQGKFLGINVNNYCFAPQQQENQQQQLENLNSEIGGHQHQSKQLQQMAQMAQNNSAEQLNRNANAMNHFGGKASYRNVNSKTEPDQQLHQVRQGDPEKQQFSQPVYANMHPSQYHQHQPNKQQQVANAPNSLHGRNLNQTDSSEFEIMDQRHQANQVREPHASKPHNFKDSHQQQLPQESHASSKRKGSHFAMVIQDEEEEGDKRVNVNRNGNEDEDEDDDGNGGGNGAEAKMSPTNMNASSRINFNASRQMYQQQPQFMQQPVVQETPQMKKLSQQQSSSNRGGSGRSSQRASSLSKAFEINKSQIQVAFGPKQTQQEQSQPYKPYEKRSSAQSKESSRERNDRQNQALQEKIASLNKSTSKMAPEAQQIRFNTNNISAMINQTPAPSAKNSPAKDANNQKVVLNDSVTQDREQLIKYIKAYVKKHGKIPHTTLDFYRFVKLLGKGAFGKITLGIHKLTGKYVAIKSIDKVNIKDEYSRRKVFQEVYILKKIRHSCVIRLLEVFESEKHFLMVMEYSGGGDLLQYVKKRKRLNEQSAKAIFKQILYALGHCHCRSVLHRDIKLDNVLMDGEGGVKLCDFGVSRLIKKGHSINEQCGTPAYLAPEIILDKGYQGFSADIWSLGVLLYAMVQGTVPFKAHNITDLHKLILKGEFEFPVDSVSDEVKDLIRKMIVLEPSERISIPSMLNHPWVFDMQRELVGDLSNLENDEEHDLRVGSTFFREEVLGGLISGYQTDGNENGNINFVNVENLYYRGGPPQKEPPTNPEEKVTYSDYCALTEDFMTYRIDEEAMDIVTGFGYPRHLVIQSINRGDVNHATAAYYLLVY